MKHKNKDTFDKLEALCRSKDSNNHYIAYQIAKNEEYPMMDELLMKYANTVYYIIVKGNCFNFVLKEKINSKEILYIHQPIINKLPEGMDRFTNLKTLVINSTGINSLPMELQECENLKNIRLYNSKIKDLPNVINYITSLEVLVITDAKLISFDIDMDKLKNLDDVVLSNSSIPEEKLEYVRKYFVVQGGNQRYWYRRE